MVEGTNLSHAKSCGRGYSTAALLSFWAFQNDAGTQHRDGGGRMSALTTGWATNSFCLLKVLAVKSYGIRL